MFDSLLQEFKMINEKSEKAFFNLELLNNLRVEFTTFAQKITEMCAKKQFRLLSLYLTATQHSLDFTHHRELFHSSDGFALTGEGVQLRDIEDLGGSLQDLQKFWKEVLESYNADPDTPKSTKRRSNVESEDSSAEKVSRKCRLERKEQEEINDPEGLEAKYKKSYIGFVKIPLNNVKIHEELLDLIMEKKVMELKEEFKKRYDPAQGNFSNS